MAVIQNLTLTEVSQDKENNTSDVRILWTSQQTGASHNTYQRSALYRIVYDEGTNYAVDKTISVDYTLPSNTTQTIVDTIVTFPHKNDGTGKIKVQTYMDTRISAGVVELVEELDLTPIPRVTTIDYLACSTKTFDGIFTFKATPKSSAFYTKAVLSVLEDGEQTEIKSIELGQATATQHTYSVSLTETERQTLYESITEASKGRIYFSLYTYSDAAHSQQIGTAKVKFIELSIPESDETKPMLMLEAAPDDIGLPSEYSTLYIQGKNRASMSLNASGSYNATIRQYSLSLVGNSYIRQYSGNCSGTEWSRTVVSDLLSASGTVRITVEVTDSRGFKSSVSASIEVLPYDKPLLTASPAELDVVCLRCNSIGQIDTSGARLRIKACGKYSAISTLNNCGISWRCRTKSSDSWLTGATQSDGWEELLAFDDDSNAIDTVISSFAFDVKTQYLVQLKVFDYWSQSDARTFDIPTEDIPFHLGRGGKNVGIGRYANYAGEYRTDVAWDIFFEKELYYKGIELVDLVHPVGSFYISEDETNPEEIFGGTWEAIEGRFLLGASEKYTAGSEGGEATHKLTVGELPWHNHGINAAHTDSGDTSVQGNTIRYDSVIVKAKTAQNVEDGASKKEAQASAKSSVRSSVTRYWKPKYLEAYKNKDSKEMLRIRKLLDSTKLYDSVVNTTSEWIKNSK